MHRWLKLSHNRHSGRLRPHEYTSYLPLALLVVGAGVVLTIGSVSALSLPPPPGPASQSVALSGEVPESPPTIAATITTPSSQASFNTSPITIAGTCPKQTIVEIFTNNIFVGSASCQSNGTYSLKVSLLFGNNILVARDYDALNQAGPNSNSVNVTYNVLPSQASPLVPLNLAGAQLLLNTEAVYRGTFPGQSLNIPVTVIGGTPPYAINVEWGDTQNSVVPRSNNTTFNVSHIYQKAGTFQITLQASDSTGQEAFLTVAAIVNGQPAIASNLSTSVASKSELLVLWPLYASAATAVCSFWLGERREKRAITHHGLTLHPQ